MNSHVHRYYRKFVDEELPIHPFHDVIALHDNRSAKWEDISKKVPSLPKGWFELARLTTKDRIDFSRDYWLETLPFVPHVHSFLHDFFADLDDVGIFLTQKTFDHPYQCEMVYSLLDGSCFFHGNPPCPDQQIASTNHLFNEDLPLDYLAFLKIHDGFCKYTDTGIIPTQKLAATHKHLTETIQRGFWEIRYHDRTIDPSELIPFYESFGLGSYQCFYLSWEPMGAAGNIFCSPREKLLSGFSLDEEGENLSFPSFLDWLMFYLERI
jgi:hypothetical protein